ncbi:DedA family protein [Umezawaea sp. NPDC059074]|uniref:DedA family protein n=1 Tax=Umezawaea sp. NPDC059074 TaxID=3346716 RepID=UPI0036B6191E
MLVALNPLDPTSLLSAFGTLGVFLVLFAETGLLVGFFLPGDSLLFTAGLLCATGPHLSLPWVLVAAAAGALIGAQVGYHLGARGGRALLDRSQRPKLHEAVERAQHLFARYGHGKAIVLARFLPIVRTVLNPVAGVVGVPPRVFVRWQVLGGLLWTVGLTVAGYVLGSSIPNVDRYLLPVIVLIVVVSLVPVGLELVRARRAR